MSRAARKPNLEETFEQQVKAQPRPDTSLLFLRVPGRGAQTKSRGPARRAVRVQVLRATLCAESERALQQALCGRVNQSRRGLGGVSGSSHGSASASGRTRATYCSWGSRSPASRASAAP